MGGTPAGRRERRPRAVRAARALLDALLGMAVLYMVYLLGAAAVASANRRADLRLLVAEARALHDAFERYGERNHGFPGAYSGSTFDLATLDPLRKRGYYTGTLLDQLHDRRADAYDSPDDLGPNREFWLELTLRSDPSLRLLVARSDDAPLGAGSWLDGVFLCRDGVLEPR